MMQKKIYSVEDDTNISYIISKTLTNAGYIVESFETGEALFTRLETELCDLLILDIMLPNMSGLDILKQIRQNVKFKDLLVLILSARGSELEKVEGLDLGADDYLAKPFGILELTSRAKALLRRKTVELSVLEFGNIVLDRSKHSCKIEEKEVNLTLKEFGLLEHFLLHPETALTRETLLQEVWGYDFYGETRTLDMHITALRKKIGVGDAPCKIEGIRGVGYRIVK